MSKGVPDRPSSGATPAESSADSQDHTARWLAVVAVTAFLLVGGATASVYIRQAAKQATPQGPTPRPAQLASDTAAAERYGRAPGQPNRLASSPYPFLNRAKDQAINWYAWGKEAFDAARELDVPVFVDSGASWCNACAAMDAGAYADPEVAELLNKHYVAIRVDRDAQPFVDQRLQTSLEIKTGAGGWPATAFLTPDGYFYAGGSYLRSESSAEAPGLKQLLLENAQAYRSRQREVVEESYRVHREVVSNYDYFTKRSLVTSLAVDTIATALEEDFDQAFGGWGRGQPKFVNDSAIAFALQRYEVTGNRDWLDMVTQTLDAMASGGLRDHIGGGFFRMTPDPKWLVPHFEKLAFVQAEALHAYVSAYEVTGDPVYRQVSLEIIDYVGRELSDRWRGGIYASQAAGSRAGDPGVFYTWTTEEVRSALADVEAQVATLYFGIEDQPNAPLPGSRDRNVLRVSSSAASIAASLGMSEDDARTAIESATQKLAQARARRSAPPVDKTIYTGWNALMISALLHAGRVLERDDLTAKAVRISDYLIDAAYREKRGFAHAVAGGQPDTFDVMEDQAYVLSALLDLHAATGDERYVEVARDVADTLILRFLDATYGGFYDVGPDADPVGVLTQPYKSIADGLTPAANPVAAMALVRLTDATNDPKYELMEIRTLGAFAGAAKDLGTRGATFGLAMQRNLMRSQEGE